MAYPEIVWTGLVIIGGFLLIRDASQLSRQGRVGVLVIFAGFLVQVYWQILHQTETPPVTWNLLSQIGVIYVTVMVVVLLLFGYPGPLGRRKKQGRVSEVRERGGGGGKRDMVRVVNGPVGGLEVPLRAFCRKAKGGGGRLRHATC